MSQRTVLIVDDNPEDRATFRRYLTRGGSDAYRITEASSAKMAFQLLLHETPDCILLDFYLPDMDGLALLNLLRDENGWIRFPIVMLTGAASTVLAVRAMRAGVQDYLPKETVTTETLSHAIDNAIEKHLLHQQLERQHTELQRRNADLEAANSALKASDTLHESEARFRLLADAAPVLIWASGVDMLYHYFNKPWLDFTGHTMEQEVDDGWADGVYPADLTRCLDVQLAAFADRQSYRMEYRRRRRDGQYRWLIDTGTPRFALEGLFLGYIGSCIDITDQKLLQEQLIESQKLESMGRLAGGIAHDFNNLLTAILGYTELSLEALPKETEVRPFLNNVSAAAERAAELTKQLLMYARRQMVEFTIVDINTVVLNLDPLLRRIIGEQYELVIALSEEACCVNANASQTEQVLTNLVVNARDAMPHGGRILIETSLVVLDAAYAECHAGVIPGPYVMYSVRDNGTGMTQEVQNHIFEPFYTTKAVGKGTGLGLATCYGIVKQSRGNIWIDSEPDIGTTFKIYLPHVRNEVQIEAFKLPDNLPEGTETIFLVDDEPMVRDVAARALRGRGYRVLEASNGAEALHVYSEWHGTIDLLVTDVIMPLMGGKELVQHLQAINPDIKVLYMSGYTQNIVLNQGILKPDVVLLTKPFTSSGLFQKVREALTCPVLRSGSSDNASPRLDLQNSHSK